MIALFLALTIVTAGKSQITGFEYFINSDPGTGNATPLTVEQGNDILGNFTIPIGSLGEGLHSLGIRAKGSQGTYSHTLIHSFYILSPNSSELSRVEYFIDTDPGHGNGVEIPLTFDSGGNIRYVVPLSEVSEGPHLLGIRTKDSQGIWSHTQRNFFYNRSDGESVNIVRLEYYYTGDGATNKIYVHEIEEPSPDVELDFTSDLSELIPDREYRIHIVAVAEDGKRSREVTETIKACGTEPALADFDLIKLGTKVSFIDSTQNATKYLWDFGDGKVDTVSNPVHEYATGGNYQVKLVASNFCNSDTIVKTVNVLSLESIFPKSGGNIGYVTTNILGGGFTENSSVRLKRGAETVEGTIGSISENERSIQVAFDLNGKEIGEWTVEVTNGGSRLELGEPFSIETAILPVIHAEFVGRTQIRAGRQERLTVKYSNTGNVDALMVPLTLQFPSSVTVELFDSSRLIKNIAEIAGIEDYREDSVSLTVTYGDITYLPLIVPIIPAKSSREIEFLITGLETSEFDILISSSSSLLENTNTPEGRILVQTDCGQAFIDMSLATLGTTLSSAGLVGIPFIKCPQSISLFLANTGIALTQYNRSNKGIGDMVLSSVSIITGGLGLVECTLLSGTPLGKMIGLGAGLINMGISIYGSEIAEEDYRNCIVPMRILSKAKMRIVAAFDPNEKVGPSNITDENYTQGRSPFTYTVFFENLDSATAAAQEVVILDTLDKNTLDLSTFQLTGYGYGGKRYGVPPGLTAYSNVRPLQRTIGEAMDVRFDAKLDTTTGVARWRMLSIDPGTGELIDDPIDGFLPPNKSSGEGEGYVTFSVQPRQELPTGARIENEALIYFDFNEPIVTNTFINTIDKIDPESKVLALPAVSTDTVFTVSWSGEDAHAGIRSYDVLVSVNDGSYGIWQYDVSRTSAEFTGHVDSVYRFYSIAKDYAGNREAEKTQFEAETKVVIQLFAIDGIATTNPVCKGTDDGTAIVNINTNSTSLNLEYSLDNNNFQDSNGFENLAPGDYTAYVRDKSDTVNTVESDFTIAQALYETPPIPVISIQGQDGISQELSLVSSSTTGNQWLKDGEEIPGATGQSIEVTESGTYQVMVTGEGGCSAISDIVAITSTPEIKTLSIKLYPNPAGDMTSIHFGKEVYIDRIVIYSSSGVFLRELERKMAVSKIEIDLLGLASGVYLLEIEGEGVFERLRFIKQ